MSNTLTLQFPDDPIPGNVRTIVIHCAVTPEDTVEIVFSHDYAQSETDFASFTIWGRSTEDESSSEAIIVRRPAVRKLAQALLTWANSKED